MARGTLTVRIIGDDGHLRRVLGGVGSRVSAVGRTLGRGLAIGAGIGTAAIAGFATSSVKALAETERGLAQTRAVLKSTGNAAGVTARDVDRLSQSLEAKVAVDAEVIRQGQNLLLTFTNIRNEAGRGNDVFTQATQVATDMSVALGQDMKSSAIQLGKALNDPIRGITALQRVGVSFTDSQKEQIKALVDAGDTMKAQKLILAELNKEFGGSAQAAGETFEGTMFKVKDAVEDAGKSVFAELLPALKEIIPTLGAAATDMIGTVGPIFARLVTVAGPAIAALIDAVAPLAEVFSSVLAEAIEAVMPTIVALAPIVGELAAAFGEILIALVPLIPPLGELLVAVAPLIAVVARLAGALAGPLGAALAWIIGLFADLIEKISGPVIGIIQFLVDKFLWAVGLLVRGAAKAFGWVPGIGPKLRAAADKFDEFRADVNRSLDGIKDKTVTVDLKVTGTEIFRQTGNVAAILGRGDTAVTAQSVVTGGAALAAFTPASVPAAAPNITLQFNGTVVAEDRAKFERMVVDAVTRAVDRRVTA